MKKQIKDEKTPFFLVGGENASDIASTQSTTCTSGFSFFGQELVQGVMLAQIEYFYFFQAS